MVKCESLRINMFRITHTGKSVNFPVTILQIVRSHWYREWTVSSRPPCLQRAVSNPLRVESLRAPSGFYKEMFRSRHLADK